VICHRIIVIFFLSIILQIILSHQALSHPHVFISQKIDVSFDNKGLAGFAIRWTFDDMFTSMIVGDYDKNQNKILEKNEVVLIKKEAFSYLSEYNYFVFIKIDGKSFDVKYIKNFSAELNDKKLVYTFFVPCHVSASNDSKQIIVASYDPSYYSAIDFPNKNPMTTWNSDLFIIKAVVKKDPSTSIYYGQINPWALFLDFRKK